ncbi:MAG: hypothetical protein ACLPLZ_00350 [Terracidiphilus sp.]
MMLTDIGNRVQDHHSALLTCGKNQWYEYPMAKKLWGIPAYEGPSLLRIRKLVQGNPKRGHSAKRFSLYRTGMTVAEYVDECNSLNVPNYALFDITWDTDPKRRFIELYK